VALNFALSAENQANVGNSATQLAFEIANHTGSPDPTHPLAGAPVWAPTPPTIVDVPGPTVFVPTPTAEAHDVVTNATGTVNLAATDGAGHMLFGSGNPSTPYVQAIDNTAGIELDLQPIIRQSATSATPASVVTTGDSITATFDMAAGAQVGSPTHSAISINWQQS